MTLSIDSNILKYGCKNFNRSSISAKKIRKKDPFQLSIISHFLDPGCSTCSMLHLLLLLLHGQPAVSRHARLRSHGSSSCRTHGGSKVTLGWRNQAGWGQGYAMVQVLLHLCSQRYIIFFQTFKIDFTSKMLLWVQLTKVNHWSGKELSNACLTLPSTILMWLSVVILMPELRAKCTSCVCIL